MTEASRIFTFGFKLKSLNFRISSPIVTLLYIFNTTYMQESYFFFFLMDAEWSDIVISIKCSELHASVGINVSSFVILAYTQKK